MSVSVETRNLSITFGFGPTATKVLPDVTFNVAPGECFGLVGESGSGKSTVLRCISMLNDIWTGDILINGKSVRDMPLIER